MLPMLKGIIWERNMNKIFDILCTEKGLFGGIEWAVEEKETMVEESNME